MRSITERAHKWMQEMQTVWRDTHNNKRTRTAENSDKTKNKTTEKETKRKQRNKQCKQKTSFSESRTLKGNPPTSLVPLIPFTKNGSQDTPWIADPYQTCMSPDTHHPYRPQTKPFNSKHELKIKNHLAQYFFRPSGPQPFQPDPQFKTSTLEQTGPGTRLPGSGTPIKKQKRKSNK